MTSSNDFPTVLPFKMATDTDSEKQRYNTFWTKEPETINWIKHFPDDNVFIDIGANIGLYSLYNSHIHPKSFTVCIEPFLGNWFKLQNNVGLNAKGNILIAPAMALSDQNGFLPFFLSNGEPGSSGGQLSKPIDMHGNEFKIMGVHDCFTMKLDSLLQIPRATPDGEKKFKMVKIEPTHIKIDVDGQENLILEGFDIAACPSLVSMLVEFNDDVAQKAYTDRLKAAGLTNNNDFNSFQPHSTTRRKESEIKSRNVIFTRESK